MPLPDLESEVLSIPALCAAAGFSFVHDPRIKLWQALWDLGESRLRASVNHSRAAGDPQLRQSIEEYGEGLSEWLRELLGDLGFPDPAILRVLGFYGSVGLSLTELDALVSDAELDDLSDLSEAGPRIFVEAD